MKNKLYLKGKKSFHFAIPIKKSLSWTSSIWLYILERAKVHSVVLSINFKCFRPSRHFLQIYSQSGTTETSCFSHSKVPTTQFLDLINWMPWGFQTDLFLLTDFLIPHHPFSLQSCLFSLSLQILVSAFSSALPDISSSSFTSQIILFLEMMGDLLCHLCTLGLAASPIPLIPQYCHFNYYTHASAFSE